MRAAILAVGSELLGTDRLDTNSLRITELLHRYGVELRRKSVVGDDIEELADEVSHCSGRWPLVVVTGGLGPTSDDLTREAVARALGRQLERQEWIVDGIRAKFAHFGREMAESNRKQGDVIAGATVLENRWGTAPGQRVDHEGGSIFLLPGVPREVEGLLESTLEPWLEANGKSGSLEIRYLRVACVSESTLEEIIEPYFSRFGKRGLSILSNPGEVLLQVSSTPDAEHGAQELDERVAFLEELLGEAVYSRRQDGDLETVVGELLTAAGATIVTAESCTGGLVAQRLTRVPGSSAYFLGSTVAYSYELKTELLGVPRETIELHGAVSEPVVTGMASGGRALMGGDYCIAISGIAGPGGGMPDKPVGTVDLAIAGPGGDVRHLRVRLPGGRDRIRNQAAQWSLDMLRRWLIGAERPDAYYLAPRALDSSGR